MAGNQVATTFTIAYWVASIPFGASLVNYSARWIWVGWILAVSFFAIPLTGILWFLVLLDRLAKLNVSRLRFAVIGTVVPALYTCCLLVRST